MRRHQISQLADRKYHHLDFIPEKLSISGLHAAYIRKTPIMQLIKPTEISARILTLLDESNERVIIVSPYINISKWYKLTNKINELKSRGISIEVYVRDDPENKASYNDLDQLKLEYKKLTHLHSKFYLNEKYGIITSMNLLLSSEFNSLEIGHITETTKEYDNLLYYYYKYIQKGEVITPESLVFQQEENTEVFTDRLKDELDKIAKNAWTWYKGNVLHVCTGKDNYSISILEGRLRIYGRMIILPGTMQKYIQHSSFITKKVGDLSAMKIELNAGPAPDLLLITGQAPRYLKSPNMTTILKNEARFILESSRKFIDATDDQWF